MKSVFLIGCVVLSLVPQLRSQADNSLLTHLTFEDRSANPVDESGTKTKVTLLGRAGYGRGIRGASAVKLIEGAHLRLENRKAYQKDTQAITVAFWTMATEFPANSRLVQKGVAGDEWQIEINYKGEFVWSMFVKKIVAVYTQVPPTDTWVHVACTFDRGTGRIFLNGRQVNSRTIADSGEIYYSRRPVILGGGMDASEQTVFPYTGYFDDFRIYSRALEPAEIAALAKR